MLHSTVSHICHTFLVTSSFYLIGYQSEHFFKHYAPF